MLLNFALIFIGIALLVWSADRFTDAASAIARNFGVSPLLVGLTIVAMGSSAPEIFVSVTASLDNSPGLAIGNAIGSNIANIALVLGVTALITPLEVDSNILRREFPVLFAVGFVAGVAISDLYLDFIDGIVLVTGMFVYLGWLVSIGLRTRVETDVMLEEMVEELPDQMTNKQACVWLSIGLVLLPVSSQILVNGATGIAQVFGVSEFTIGLTIVALGTSLPELAASVAGVLKGEHELAIGNVIGSNIFNLLAVLGIVGLIRPAPILPSVLYSEYLLMMFLFFVMFVMAYGFKGPGRIGRLEGGLLFSVYIGFLVMQ
ncbi:MAG: calcium/sodium antiporter [Gammaproteobacteria bacterium]|nr:MAG: calcium/sodium antiporter [Gammaproteobacteria bacterium]